MDERLVQFDAEGWRLEGTLLAHDSPSRDAPVVLLSGAAAVPHRYYMNFARHLVEQGVAAVLLYDYRGIARSAGKRSDWKGLSMLDWATLDMPAALDFLKNEAPARSIVGVGHSYGGQAVGLSGRADEFARYATVATMSGYWRELETPISVWLQTQVLGSSLSRIIGRVPGAIGIGETMPGPIFLDWARWIAHPDYFFSDPRVSAADFERVTLPYLTIGIEDDPWANPTATYRFMSRYGNAALQEIWLPAKGAGHLGFFRRAHRDFWPVVTEWVLHGTAASAEPFGTRYAASSSRAPSRST